MIQTLSTDQQAALVRIIQANPTAALGRVVQALQKTKEEIEKKDEPSDYDPARHSAWGEE